MKWAMICQQTKRVYNCVEWDGIDKWSPPDGFYMVQDDRADRYDLHDVPNNKFIKHEHLPDYPHFKPEMK